MSIKIAIADDHPLVVSGLKSILPHYTDIILIGAYANGDELLAGLQEEQPDVLLLDIQLPGKTGDELAPVLLRRYPDMKILILTNFDSTLIANTVLSGGSHGYLLKTVENEVLFRAIETVYQGGIFVEDTMKTKMEQADFRIKKSISSKSNLTPREKEILQLIVNGNTNPEIAEKLILSPKTIDNFRTNIMMKMEVNNTAALVKKALRLGLAE